MTGLTLAPMLSPHQVLEQVAQAIPAALRDHIIIVGSLAAASYFFDDDRTAGVRTKDVDCLFTPNAKAVSVAAAVTEQLLQAAWTLREDAQWGRPGTAQTPLQALPMVRLKPPAAAASPAAAPVPDGARALPWFLELLAAPPPFVAGADEKQLERVSTASGDFALCSFSFLRLVEWEPLLSPSGLRVARPSMMALANALHHPTIGQALIGGTQVKRSNKDLGRAIALAYLAQRRDRALGTRDFEAWPREMAQALRTHFAEHAAALAERSSAGLRALLSSPPDLHQAVHVANLSLLARLDVDVPAFAGVGRRLVGDVLERLALS